MMSQGSRVKFFSALGLVALATCGACSAETDAAPDDGSDSDNGTGGDDLNSTGDVTAAGDTGGTSATGGTVSSGGTGETTGTGGATPSTGGSSVESGGTGGSDGAGTGGTLEPGDCYHPDADGVIVIEAESVPADGWSLESNFAGFQGSGYYCDRSGSAENELVFRFVVPATGDYRLSVRNYQDGDGHESNDAWSELDDFGEIKLFTHAVYAGEAGQFSWNTGLDDHYGSSINLMPANHANDEDPGSHFVKPAGYQLTAGEHTLYLRGRSVGYCIDRIHIYPDSMLPGSAAVARDLSKPESVTGACQ